VITRLRNGFTYANLMSTVAVFIAIGGASYAAGLLPRNSVDTRQVRPNAITQPKLAFSLGMAHSAPADTTTFDSSACPPGASCPAPIPQTVAETSARFRHATKVLLLGSAEFTRADSRDSTPVEVQLGTRAQDTIEGSDGGQLDGSGSVTLKAFRVVPATGAGRRAFGLEASAVARGPSGVTVNVSNPQLIAIALPAAR
jgi:hypothetical protein